MSMQTLGDVVRDLIRTKRTGGDFIKVGNKPELDTILVRGLVVHYAIEVENVFNTIIKWHYLKGPTNQHNEFGSDFLKNMSFVRKAEVVGHIISRVTPNVSHLSELRKIAKEISELRNRVAHWQVGLIIDERLQLNQISGKKKVIEPIDLRSFALKCETLELQLIEYFEEVFIWPWIASTNLNDFQVEDPLEDDVTQ